MTNKSVSTSINSVLSRSEMKQIIAGVGGGECRAYSTTFGWSSFCTDVQTAQYEYNNNDSITGYCCESCGEGNFSNAAPCDGGSTQPEEN